MADLENPRLCVAGFSYLEIRVGDFIHPPAGCEIFVDNIGVSMGGVFNTALAARRLGIPGVQAAFPQGEGLSDLIMQAVYQRFSIATFTWAARSDPAISLVFNDNHDRSFLSSCDHQALGRCPHLPQAKWLHFPGLLELVAMRRHAKKARDSGTPVSVSGSWLPEKLKNFELYNGCWDVLFLNEKEAACISSDIAQLIKKLDAFERTVIITRGAMGAVACVKAKEYHFRSEASPAVKTTVGAGDAYAAGYIAGLLKKSEPDECLQIAHDAATAWISSGGSAALTVEREEL
jgi:sugar/nucleoside kinase (ribokinase family)